MTQSGKRDFKSSQNKTQKTFRTILINLVSHINFVSFTQKEENILLRQKKHCQKKTQEQINIILPILWLLVGDCEL